jgi:hypothetical protein
MRKPTYRIGTKARREIAPCLSFPGLPCPQPEKGRIPKAKAARLLGISRRTVIRYAAEKLISQDSKGRVRLFEIADVLLYVPTKRWHPTTERLGFSAKRFSAKKRNLEMERRCLLGCISERRLSCSIPEGVAAEVKELVYAKPHPAGSLAGLTPAAVTSIAKIFAETCARFIQAEEIKPSSSIIFIQRFLHSRESPKSLPPSG